MHIIVEICRSLYYLVFMLLTANEGFFLQTDRKKKESIFELSKFLDKRVRVKFQGGREGERY